MIILSFLFINYRRFFIMNIIFNRLNEFFRPFVSYAQNQSPVVAVAVAALTFLTAALIYIGKSRFAAKKNPPEQTKGGEIFKNTINSNNSEKKSIEITNPVNTNDSEKEVVELKFEPTKKLDSSMAKNRIAPKDRRLPNKRTPAKEVMNGKPAKNQPIVYLKSKDGSPTKTKEKKYQPGDELNIFG